MTPYQYVLLIIFGVMAYFIIIDPNVGAYLTLVFKMIGINIQRFLWMLRFHPMWLNNPISKWRRERHYLKLIKEMEEKADVYLRD